MSKTQHSVSNCCKWSKWSKCPDR